MAARHAGFRVGMFTSPHLIEPLDAISMAEHGQERAVRSQWQQLEKEVQVACGLNQAPKHLEGHGDSDWN